MKPISLTHRLKSLGKSLLIGSALLLPLVQQAAAQTFTNNIVDYGDGTSAAWGILKTHTDGSIYAFWRDGNNTASTGTPAEYKLIKWNEGTAAWGLPIGSIIHNNIPGLAPGFLAGEYADLAIDSAGGFHVVVTLSLSAPASGNGVVYAYSATGSSWTYSTVLNYTGINHAPSYVSLELDSQDKPHVFVLEKNGGTGDSPFGSRIFTAWNTSPPMAPPGPGKACIARTALREHRGLR